LPGGQVFIPAALYNQPKTKGQLAGVLGHEVGPVIERHGPQRLAKQKLTQGLVGAAGVAGYDPRAMMGVMKILDEASKGNSTPEILSTHPKPANRAAYVEKVIAQEFPNGLGDDLRP